MVARPRNLPFRLPPHMKLVTFLGTLGLGGTEEAARRWARGLKARGHDVTLFTLKDGPRRAEAEAGGVPVRLLQTSAHDVAEALREIAPTAIHAHAPGHPYISDVLGEQVALRPFYWRVRFHEWRKCFQFARGPFFR